MSALDDKQYGVTVTDGSMGYKGEAMALDKKFTGSTEEDKKFEDEPVHNSVSAVQMALSGSDR
jgi:hypothetical protein